MHSMISTYWLLSIQSGSIDFRSVDRKDRLDLAFNEVANARRATRQAMQKVFRIEMRTGKAYVLA